MLKGYPLPKEQVAATGAVEDLRSGEIRGVLRTGRGTCKGRVICTLGGAPYIKMSTRCHRDVRQQT